MNKENNTYMKWLMNKWNFIEDFDFSEIDEEENNLQSRQNTKNDLINTLRNNWKNNKSNSIKILESKLARLKASLERKENLAMEKRWILLWKWKRKEISNEEFAIESKNIQDLVDKIYEEIKKLERNIRLEKTESLLLQTKRDYKNIFVDDIWIENHYKSYLEWKNLRNWWSHTFWVYEIPHTDFLLIERSEESFEYLWNLTYYTSLLDNNPNIPRTLKTFVCEGKMYQIIEKAKGVQLDKINIALLENIPQKDFDKLVENILMLREKWLTIDPSKQSNFFYDSKIGISIIDLSQWEVNIKYIEKNLVSLFTRWQNNLKIQWKIRQAMKNNNIN